MAAARPLTPALALKRQGRSTSGVSIESTVKVTDQLWEPSGASDGDTVFMTGNWDADFSSDGQHFTQVNPKELNPSFCCDQIVQYAPSVDRFFWLVQGAPNASNENVDVLAEPSPGEPAPEQRPGLDVLDLHRQITRLRGRLVRLSRPRARRGRPDLDDGPDRERWVPHLAAAPRPAGDRSGAHLPVLLR